MYDSPPESLTLLVQMLAKAKAIHAASKDGANHPVTIAEPAADGVHLYAVTSGEYPLYEAAVIPWRDLRKDSK